MNRSSFTHLSSTLLVITFALTAAVPPSDAKFLLPSQAAAQMTLPDGFEVKVALSEPNIGETIAFCFDVKGRLWTLDNLNYMTRRLHSSGTKNRIQIFEDSDGDGVFDKKKLFTDNLTFSSGLAIGHGGVYVGMPPELIFIPDANHDDTPDGPHEVLLNGWGINDRHETLNSFNWGPDGWLYGCHGVYTDSMVGKPGAPESQRQFIDGGIWRFHPIKKDFEIYAEGLSNPWGFDFNDAGQGFATGCVIPHLFHIIQGGVYHKQSKPNRNAYVYDTIKTIRDHVHKSAHGGARFYLANTFPEKYRDTLFMCNIHEHNVLTDIMVRNGSGYIGKHGEEFMETHDLAWVGFSVLIGPEGAVYILDWHDQDICGNSVKFPNSARVYRIAPKNIPPLKKFDLNQLSDLELVAIQSHENDWYVRKARVILQMRAANKTLNSTKVHPQLETMFHQASNYGKRLRAFWALQATGRFDGTKESDLFTYLNHSDEFVRARAVQFIAEDKKVSDELLAKFAQMATSETSAVVRLYLSAALQRLPYEKRWTILENLASHEEDNHDHNLPKMIWLALEPMVKAQPARALTLAINSKMSNLQEYVPRRMLVGTSSSEAKDKVWQTNLNRIAPGFSIRRFDMEKGLIYLPSFKNSEALQTYPISHELGVIVSRKVSIPKDKTTRLNFSVSFHPHQSWRLEIKINGEKRYDQVISSATLQEEWLSSSLDLSAYADQNVTIELFNHPLGKSDQESAYWKYITLTSQ